MASAQHGGAAAPGPVTPTSDEAPAGSTAQGFREDTADPAYSGTSQHTRQARVASPLDAAHAFRATILAALGCAPDVIEPGKLQRFGPSGRASDKSAWCKLFDDLRGGVYGDWRSGTSETWTAHDRHTMTRQQRAALARQVEAASRERLQAQRVQWRANAERVAALWAEGVPVRDGDPVAQYLRRRVPGLVAIPECLRLHPALPYWDEGRELGRWPAMLAPLRNPAAGKLLAVHRTWLTADGRKAAVPTVRKLSCAAGPLAGACIPLMAPQRGQVGIAEGIETALASHLASGLPVVAAYCAGNLAAWRWPGGVRRVVVFADADAAGRDAAHTLRGRVRAAGLRCDVLAPTDDGADWCDVWAQRGAVEVRA